MLGRAGRGAYEFAHADDALVARDPAHASTEDPAAVRARLYPAMVCRRMMLTPLPLSIELN